MHGLARSLSHHSVLDLSGAEPLMRKAHRGLELWLGPRHKETLGSIHDLATLLMEQGMKGVGVAQDRCGVLVRMHVV